MKMYLSRRATLVVIIRAEQSQVVGVHKKHE
jgi:hypothetical protein